MAGQRLGQNFLVDQSTARRIVDAVDLAGGRTLVEIGAGKGALTAMLAGVARKFVAVEYDPQLASELRKRLGSVQIVTADARRLEPRDLGVSGDYVLVGNLPYYASRPILRHFLELRHKPSQIVVMVQKEVGDAICAPDGALNFMAVCVRVFATPKLLFSVPPQAFNPVPKVVSAVIDIVPHVGSDDDLQNERRARFLDFVHAGFRAPRKQLPNSLARGLNIEVAITRQMVASIGVRLNDRPANLTVKQWWSLFDTWHDRGEPRNPAHHPDSVDSRRTETENAG